MGTNGKPEPEVQPQRSAVGRGPSYPAIDIEAAIEKARLFWDQEKRSAAPLAAAAKHWGYSEASSSGRVMAAALLQYGLLEDSGSKDSRTLKLTGRGLDILLDATDSPNRLRAVQDAVRAPKAYGDVFAKWAPDELPSDQTLRYFLLRDKGFNEGAVDGFIQSLRASVVYAKLDKPTIIPLNGDEREADKTAPKMSDPEVIVPPLKEWPYPTGTPRDVAPPPHPAHAMTGEREWLRGPLSRGASYRLVVSGEVGPKEIGKLIKLLEAQKAVLDDDDEL